MLHLKQMVKIFGTKSQLAHNSIPSLLLKRDFLGSREYNPNEKIDFEVSKDPEEWKYVSRLLPLKIVPEPTVKPSYPSGWKPQNPQALAGPYYVRRSRNHMIPVYMKIEHRGTKKTTIVRHVLGDIWQFATDLVKYVESKALKSVGYRVDEVGCKVVLRGDFHYYTSQFLLEKGF